MAKAKQTALEAAGREVVITNPDKIFFPQAGHTKLDLAKYYLAVAEGALRGIAGRPIVLKRYVNGADQEPFFQKRAPDKHPDWIETVELRFPSGRTAREIVVRDAAQLLWIINLGCIDLNPHPVRVDDLDHPDELRVDLDPGPGVGWDTVRQVALTVHAVLEEHGVRGWPKTSGSRGMHVNVRLERRWTSRARWSGAFPSSRPASGGRKNGMVSSSTTTRTPRIAPSLRPGRFGRHRMRAYRCRSHGTRSRNAIRRHLR